MITQLRTSQKPFFKLNANYGATSLPSRITLLKTLMLEDPWEWTSLHFVSSCRVSK